MDRFWVLRLRRDGAPIPRWQQSQAAWVDGRLRVLEERDDQLRRCVMCGCCSSIKTGWCWVVLSGMR